MTDNGVVRVALAEALIAAAGDGLVAVDRSGEIVVFNPAAGRIFGVDPEEMIGQSLERLFQPGEYERHRQYIQDYFADRGRGSIGSTLEVEGWHREGRPVPLEISLSATTADGQQLVLASIRDISGRQKAAHDREGPHPCPWSKTASGRPRGGPVDGTGQRFWPWPSSHC